MWLYLKSRRSYFVNYLGIVPRRAILLVARRLVLVKGRNEAVNFPTGHLFVMKDELTILPLASDLLIFFGKMSTLNWLRSPG